MASVENKPYGNHHPQIVKEQLLIRDSMISTIKTNPDFILIQDQNFVNQLGFKRFCRLIPNQCMYYITKQKP